MKKILVIGANGFTGRRLLNDFSNNTNYSIIGCSLHPDIKPGNNYSFICTDIRNRENVKEVFRKTQPDIVINTSALSVPDFCEIHHAEALETNVTSVEYLSEFCKVYKSRFIHLSTDFVFDGKSDKLYTECDKPNPVNYYGFTKVEGEKRVSDICENFALVRVAVVYGRALPGQHGNVLQLVADKIRLGEKIRVVSDQWRTPTFVGDIFNGVNKLIHLNSKGIYHICGPECLTIAELAYRVADYLKLDNSLILPVTTEEMNEKTPRPRFSGLSIKKAQEELEYSPLSLEQGLREMFY